MSRKAVACCGWKRLERAQSIRYLGKATDASELCANYARAHIPHVLHAFMYLCMNVCTRAMKIYAYT